MPARVLKKPAAKAAAKKKKKKAALENRGDRGGQHIGSRRKTNDWPKRTRSTRFREYFNSEAPPLKKEQALVPVKQEELQAPPALNEAFLAAALNEEPSDLQDAATQTPKNWAKELKSANLKIVKTRPRYYQRLLPTGFPATSAISSGHRPWTRNGAHFRPRFRADHRAVMSTGLAVLVQNLDIRAPSLFVLGPCRPGA